MNSDITAILNGYKRPECIKEQLIALNSQTILPDEILLWYNHPEDSDIDYELVNNVRCCVSNINLGVWARFSYALNSKTKYVCVFDDDIIPGNRWFENCLKTIKNVNGLLGGVGLLYLNKDKKYINSYYDPYIRFGWIDNGINNIETVEVDFVGHAWFFEREWLSYFWRELPDKEYIFCGEDMHFSFMLQKYANIHTYVPPHPPDDRSLWSNIIGGKYGNDNNSLWNSNKINNLGISQRQALDLFFKDQRKKGWKLINDI